MVTNGIGNPTQPHQSLQTLTKPVGRSDQLFTFYQIGQEVDNVRTSKMQLALIADWGSSMGKLNQICG